ncbi:dephospho-CoA kinase [Prochlorococcus marinus]|uniref:dephospho-CoA kinase n=1 Tax=Prochlorococcus TaxID=1218 RepID=UPI0007B3F332|nr:dephospho-CoA kinase [Prochlorococcus marinus]KZR77165.1 Dephospho-CoA kinase [Prochlorococcus marinus str. MIT 1323]
MTAEPISTVLQPPWSKSQRRIGLTGGIATGKSSVGHYLAEQHALAFLDADLYARAALAPGSAATKAVLQRYGKAVAADSQNNESSLDRSALGKIVFNDAAERYWLEQLVHPIVRQRFEADLALLTETTPVVLMIPLLFEAKLTDLCSEVWLVDCSSTQQCQRLMNRDELSRQDSERRIAAQWPMSQKRDLADLVIDNSGSPNSWKQVVDQALRQEQQ